MQKTLYHKLRYNCSNPNYQCFQLKDPLETLIELVGFWFCSYYVCIPGYTWVTAGICKRSLKKYFKKQASYQSTCTYYTRNFPRYWVLKPLSCKITYNCTFQYLVLSQAKRSQTKFLWFPWSSC